MTRRKTKGKIKFGSEVQSTRGRTVKHLTRCSAPGATVADEGVYFCVWAPAVARVTVEIESSPTLPKRSLILERQGAGYHRGLDGHGREGDAYAYRLDAGPPLPDPASRAQEAGVHGRSLVVDAKTYRWRVGTLAQRDGSSICFLAGPR